LHDVEPAPDLVFERMPGHWTFERRVTPHASMSGKAEIALISHREALYCESARIQLATGEVISGTQSYLYRRRGSGFDILFAETGLLFQSLQFRYDGRNLVATATHTCIQDRYVSEYVLGPANRMFVRHTVRGPAKSYVSETVFQRVS
jgi:Family of unknown function (DUF6314)